MLLRELYKKPDVDEDQHPNEPPRGPETKPTMPAGTVRVDVSDVYDWYKLGQHISNLKGLGKHDFGKGPPSTILSFGSEEEEHEYIKNLMKTGLTTTDIDPVDPNQPKNMPRQKVDPTYNVGEAKKKKTKRKARSADYGPGPYGYYGYYPGYSGDSGAGEGSDGGGMEENFADGQNSQTQAAINNREAGPEWESKLMDIWSPKASRYMARVVKQSFNSLYPDVKLKVWAEDEGVTATTDLASADVKADVFGQYGKKDWECNFFCGPLFNHADGRKYLELMVDDAASGSYPGVWKIIVSEWKKWASSQLKNTGADDVCFSVNEDMSGGAWGKIAQAVGIKYIAHDLDEGVAENFADGKNPQDKGDSKRHGVPTKASVSTLRKVAKQGGRKGQLAHWMANMKAGRKKTTESIDDLNIIHALEKFLPLVMKVLELEKLPKISLKKEIKDQHQPTFGRFINDPMIIEIGLANRHPNDILRTLAHELVHFKQLLNGQIGPHSGDTGSPQENEANAKAGIIMRLFNKHFPEYLEVKPIMLETATAGSTSAGNIASVISPQVAIGSKKARKSYGSGSSPNPPKAKQIKNADGTAKNALDIKTNIFGGSPLKR